MLVSSLAYSIARSINLNKEEQENARVSGILHDIGKLMLFKIPDFFQKVQLNKNGLISVESEYKVLGTSHAEMGAYLMGIWGLPNPIVEAITFHHRPGVQISKKADLMTALYVANGLANMWQIEKDINYNAYLDMNYLEKVGVVDRLDEWTYLVRELIKIAN
jgi:putative nucleotidyltransferase with HDIG domain